MLFMNMHSYSVSHLQSTCCQQVAASMEEIMWVGHCLNSRNIICYQTSAWVSLYNIIHYLIIILFNYIFYDIQSNMNNRYFKEFQRQETFIIIHYYIISKLYLLSNTEVRVIIRSGYFFLRVHEDRRKEELIGKEKQYVSLNAVVQTIVGTVEKGQTL